MTNTPTTIENNAMPVVPESKYALVKSIAAKGATDMEFELLMYIANKYRLDPLLKEIWCIKRNPNDPALIMTSRDGYLSVAHRSGKEFVLQNGTIEDEKGNLVKAWAECWIKGADKPFRSEVKYSEYKQNSFVWQKYPSAMLVKVAEVFVLKRAFSISGIVSSEEIELPEVKENISGNSFEESRMNEAFERAVERDPEPGVLEPVVELDIHVQKATKKQVKMIQTILSKQDLKVRKNTEMLIKKFYKIKSFNDLTKEQAAIVIDRLIKRSQGLK